MHRRNGAPHSDIFDSRYRIAAAVDDDATVGHVTVDLRWEQCCESANCTKPAHHGVLCAACFRAATPARRAVELLGSTPDTSRMPVRADRVSDEGAAWLAHLWAA